MYVLLIFTIACIVIQKEKIPTQKKDDQLLLLYTLPLMISIRPTNSRNI
jgi:hypothetical protein